jgi:hypothetical protein
MSVIKEERDCLGRVLRRYQATGTIDAVLAEVERRLGRGVGIRVVAGRDHRPGAAPADAGRRRPTFANSRNSTRTGRIRMVPTATRAASASSPIVRSSWSRCARRSARSASERSV